ncbi:glycosyltransferase [Phyllobacterium sp. SYP-B3895]|uniref:glycosyltransferase n=1 Tax=Phyllobacterium sp. SYP-B3895 TaxID=2663240 RepID=UPI001561D3B2
MQTLAVVVPVYAGDQYLEDLISEVERLRSHWALASAPISLTRVVLVDDNAIDGSAAVIDRLSDRFQWVEAIHLSRNFGQHPATVAGILRTEEDWVATIDEDLQHPPSGVPILLQEAVQTHSDVVYGKPKGKVHQAASRDWTSRTFKRLIEIATGEKNITQANSFRLMRGSVARAAAKACADDTYFDSALFWFTRQVRTVTMDLKDTRFITTGKSGYRMRSLLSHARRLLISSQIKVLRVGALFGFSVALISALTGFGVLVLSLLDPGAITEPGWTSIMVTTIFFGGTILFLNGIVLEYISVLLQRSNGRPLFFAVDRSGDGEIARYFDHEITPLL